MYCLNSAEYKENINLSTFFCSNDWYMYILFLTLALTITIDMHVGWFACNKYVLLHPEQQSWDVYNFDLSISESVSWSVSPSVLFFFVSATPLQLLQGILLVFKTQCIDVNMIRKFQFLNSSRNFSRLGLKTLVLYWIYSIEQFVAQLLFNHCKDFV